MIQEILTKIETVNKERFSDLNGRNIISVTKLQDYVTTPFDKEKQAKLCEEKGQKDPNYKYAGKTADEIIKMWEDKAAESIMYGNLLDEYTEQRLEKDPTSLELWKLDNNFENDVRLRNNCLGFDEFYAEITSYGYEVVGREIPVYLQTPSTVGDLPFDNQTEEGNNVVVGRIDCLFHNPVSGKYLIVDWKTTDEIKTEAFAARKMKGPANQWQDCDMAKYTIQLHMYKTALAHTYGLASLDKIVVVVCNLRKEQDPATTNHYILYKQNFDYNDALIYQVVDFSIKKRALLNNKQSHQ